MSESKATDAAGVAASRFAGVSKGTLRNALLGARAALHSDSGHPARQTRLSERIARVLEQRAARCVGFYWPTQGEYDARQVLADWLAQDEGRRAALPVVADPLGPLAFYRWTPDTPMIDGRFGIPVPAHAVPESPDLLLVPCVAFDPARYRLGYGGGFYDRTLAALSPRPYAVGIAYECTRVDALPVEPHDIPLDAVVTESACYPSAHGPLEHTPSR